MYMNIRAPELSKKFNILYNSGLVSLLFGSYLLFKKNNLGTLDKVGNLSSFLSSVCSFCESDRNIFLNKFYFIIFAVILVHWKLKYTSYLKTANKNSRYSKFKTDFNLVRLIFQRAPLSLILNLELEFLFNRCKQITHVYICLKYIKINSKSLYLRHRW